MDLTSLDHESAHRLCPIHQKPTHAALTTDGGGYSLVWECRDCSGWWSEEFFLIREWAALPLLRPPTHARWRCPRCASERFQSSCEYACFCGQHVCLECGQDIFIRLNQTHPTTLAAEKIRELADQRWGEFGLCQGPGNLLECDPLIYIALPPAAIAYLECFPCQSSGNGENDVEHELVWAPDALSELDRYAWRCRGCGAIRCMSYFAGLPPFFFQSTAPDLRCRVCHHAELDQSTDLTSIACRTCGAQFTLSTTVAPERPAPSAS